MDAAITRSCWWRFRLRRRRDRGCSARDDEARGALIHAALRLLRRAPSAPLPYSSLHVLFPTETEARACEAAGMVIRHGLQFRWLNRGYRDFADFLSTFNHEKRKKVKQERRKVAEAGVTFTRKIGDEITAADWAFFHRCYPNTYRDHGSTPYLNLEFFERIGAEMPSNVMLAVGHRDDVPLCAALDLFDRDTLWGRYWGATDFVPGCISKPATTRRSSSASSAGSGRFEGGAQGVHKLARGLTPVTTWSAHAIADPDFASAIDAFCARERVDVAHASTSWARRRLRTPCRAASSVAANVSVDRSRARHCGVRRPCTRATVLPWPSR